MWLRKGWTTGTPSEEQAKHRLDPLFQGRGWGGGGEISINSLGWGNRKFKKGGKKDGAGGGLPKRCQGFFEVYHFNIQKLFYSLQNCVMHLMKYFSANII